MADSNEKVILFPKWKYTLEQESLQALKEKKFEEALKKLNELINYNITNHEILIGKLICLMELNRYEEAEHLCEEVLQKKDENYFRYVHIYLTLLFQTGQYALLMEFIDEEISNQQVPSPLKDQFQQLYEISQKMEKELVEDVEKEQTEKFIKAINDEDYERQWRILEELKSKKAVPNIEIIGLLKEKHVHPVIKTGIIQWLQEKDYEKEVSIQKFGIQIHKKPSEIPEIKKYMVYQHTLQRLNEVEQRNPTLFNMIEQILYRYAYIRYPFMPEDKKSNQIAEALKVIGERNLNLHNEMMEVDETLIELIEEIETCEKLFLSIIEL